jgi:hypothetical protein
MSRQHLSKWTRNRIRDICKRLKRVTAKSVLEELQGQQRSGLHLRLLRAPSLHQVRRYLPTCRYLVAIEKDETRNRPTVYEYREIGGATGDYVPNEDTIIGI